MEQEEIRAKIREKLKAGVLPRNLPTATRLAPGEVVEAPHIQVGLVKGHPCSACGGEGPQITYKYPSDEVRFHHQCERLWQEERQKL